MVYQMAEGCYFLLDKLLLQFGHMLSEFLDHQLISFCVLLQPHKTLQISFIHPPQFRDLHIFRCDFLKPHFYLTLEHPVLLQQLALNALIMVKLNSVFLTHSLVFILLVLHPHQTLLQLCDFASQDAFLLLQDLHQLLVLLILLRQQQEILSLQLLPVPISYRSLLHRQVHYIPIHTIQHIMQYLKPELQGEEASVIFTLLDASREIAEFLRHSPVVVMESTNLFGDQQLHQDIKCDQIVEKHLKGNALVKAFASEERPHYQQIAEGEGFAVTYDPLDGSSIIDTNFAIGSIFSIWRTDPSNLVGKTLGDQVNAVITVYGPRTTALIYNSSRKIVQELTLIQKEWVISHEHLVIKPKSKMFSPGNLRAVNENEAYDKVVTAWIRKGYTLRYTGGLVPDVGQIFIKGHGVLSNIGSESHKCKLRALYEAAAVGFLVEKAGGSSITTGRKSLMEFKITSYDDRLSFAVGSSEEIQALAHLF